MPAMNNQDIFPAIREAISNDRLVIFVGAGVSRVIGCSGWEDLARELVDAALENKRIDFYTKREIERYEPRKIITIIKEYLPEEMYKKTVEESLKGNDEKKKKYPIYEELYKMRGIYLTTNVDIHFDQLFEDAKIFIYPYQFDPDRIEHLSLYHLHGSLKDFSTVILTTPEYIRHYNKTEIRDFLEFLFTNYTVLFVGYGLEELEILDYILLKGNSTQESSEKSREARHFVLLPCFRTEDTMLELEKTYFSGLNLLPFTFPIDEKGYDQLYYVIEDLAKEINRKTSFLDESFQFIEQNIEHYDKENALKIFQLIKNDEHIRDHFFKNVKSTDWFYPLKEKGFFSAENAPSPKASDEENYFAVPQWNILPYLERVSQKVNIPDNEKYVDELLTIIRNVSNFRDVNNRHIDNYRTWWYFTKILLNIPNKSIPLEIIDLIPIWLNSRFDTSLTVSEIATKLLPKFLPDIPANGDIQKAEKILGYITEIKGIDEGEEPRTSVDYFWLIESLIKQGNAAKIGEKCTENLLYLIADRLKKVFRHQNPSLQIRVEVEDSIYYFDVLHTEDYEFDCSVTIVNKQTNATESLNFKIVECKNDKCFIERVKEEIIKSTIIKEVEEKLDEELERLYEFIYYDYSSSWLGSLSEVTDLTIYKAEQVLPLILRDVLLTKAKKDRLVTQSIFKRFLGDEYPYPLFKRLVLFVIGEYWTEFKQEFWKIIDAPDGEKIFDDSNCKPEIYTLLEKNRKKFTSQEKERIREIIEKGPQKYLPEENRDFYANYWKQQWYSALKSDPDFTRLYNMYRGKTQAEERISFEESTVKYGPTPSPLTKEEILEMSNEELARFLSEFRTKDLLYGPTVDGLSNTLREAVQEKPEKFLSNLLPFLNTSYYHIYSVLRGAKDAWNNKKPIEWNSLFCFIKQYLNRNEFWRDEFKMQDHDFWDADHRRVAGMVGELIQDGIKDDDWAFPESCLPTAEEILFLILDNLKTEYTKEISNPVTYALNSPLGKTITAMILLSWRIAKLEDKKSEKKEIKWQEDTKNKYDNLLRDRKIEAYILLGQYMHVLHVMDRMWVEQKVTEFNNIEKRLWAAFMSGYLFNRIIYHNLYKLMREHYLRAISHPFEEKYAEEGVIQHIALSYLYDVEDLSEDRLFGKILERWNPSQIQELIGFFWIQKERLSVSTGKEVSGSDVDENEKLRRKIIEFWRWLYEKYRGKDPLDEDDKKILSKVALLAVFLPKIDDESVEWLMLSAPFIYLDQAFLFFIEYLDSLKDKGNRIESSKHVGRIFLKMLNGFILEFKEDYIRSIVEFLYETKEEETTEMANEICNIYLSNQLEFLRDIYEKYNRKAS